MTDPTRDDEVAGALDAADRLAPVEASRSAFSSERWRTVGEIDGGSWTEDKPPPQPWLLRATADPDTWPRVPNGGGVIPRGVAGMLAAAGGIGKSTILMDLAVAITSSDGPGDGRGRFAIRWLDVFDVDPDAVGPVVFVAAEDREAAVRRRLWASMRRCAWSTIEPSHRARFMQYGRVPDVDESAPRTVIEAWDTIRERVRDRLVVVPCAGLVKAFLASTDRGAFDASPAFHELVERIKEGHAHGPWRAVLLDPFAHLAGTDAETDNAAANKLLDVLAQLVNATGADESERPAVIVAHHTSQDARKAEVLDATAARGVTGITDAGRWMMVIAGRPLPERDDVPELVRLAIPKNNEGPTVRPINLARTGDGGLQLATRDEVAAYEAATPKAAKATPAPVPTATRGKGGRDPAADDA
jgi:hypothetical protein